ncbi:uncharacterized protein LOC142224509 [Haematobia irritans]|uniref:uncharacterized protein LOC142224509 n=1 Tax=Haematobia irritans TaxID=7368 RepID=UPI003F500124
MDNISLQGQSQQQHQNEILRRSICSICGKPIDGQIIKCSKCINMVHQQCIENASNHPNFVCVICSREERCPDSPTSTHSRRSNASNSSRNSIIRKRDLERRRLEEERSLAIQRDREFLQKKYKLLEQAEEELDNIDIQPTNDVHEWVNSLPDPERRIPSEEHPNTLDLLQTTYIDLPQNNEDLIRPFTSNVDCIPTTNTPSVCANNRGETQKTPSSANGDSNQISRDICPPNGANAVCTGNDSNSTVPLCSTHREAPVGFNMNSAIMAPESTSFALPSLTADPCCSMSTNLTHQQINARQTVPKDLPIFTGKPEEWPLFSSTYNWSTKVCGLTDAENLVRLQKALRGDALQAVQNILIHPSCVPSVISTLQLLFGQPEKILNSLKKKIRSLPAVNPTKLDTITAFAVQVKGLHATIEACQLFDELNNSSLLQELIAKLPSYFQINWGTHKMNLVKSNKRITLLEFSNWIFDIGLSASSVNVESTLASSTEAANSTVNCHKFKTADRAERWNIVREFRLCKQCLRRHYGSCNSNIKCSIDGCEVKHHPLLHRMQSVDEINQRGMSNNRQTSETGEQQNENQNIENCNTHNTTTCHSLFKIIPITIYGNKNKSIKTFAFIDEGSSTSLMEQNIVKELNLSSVPEPLCLKWTGDVERSEEDSRRLSIAISGSNGRKYTADVHTVKYLSLPQQSVNITKLKKDFSHLIGIPVESYENARPRLLIGVNNSRLCISRRVIEGKPNEPVAILTRLGWLLFGSLRTGTPEKHHHYHICECNIQSDKKLFDLVKNFYCLESSGIVTDNAIMSKYDEKAISILQNYTRQRTDGHYETALLWRQEDIVLPNSLDMAKKRYFCLEKRLRADKELNLIFEKTIHEYLAKGYVAKVEGHETSAEKIWYLPVFPVFNKNKPGKVRIVWDAAAISQGVSLNSMLLKGPDLLSSLPSILLRFRQKVVAMCADIEQMFHQIFIRYEDRHAQRFLWRSDGKDEPDIYVMNVMIFGASCAPCISQYVKNIHADKFAETYPGAVSSIKINHYVDDFLESVDTIEEAIRLAKDVKMIHSKAGFNIRNWICNRKEVLAALSTLDDSKNKNLQLGCDIGMDKILGVYWKSSDDSISFKVSTNLLESTNCQGNQHPTKRKLLKILMSIYDPLGLIGHFLMYLKIVLQDVWRSGVGWDEEILPHHCKKWSNWLARLHEMENLRIPRCYLQRFSSYTNMDVQLHTFSDASENGYAAVSYLRICSGRDVVVSLIGSKTRVAPLRVTSIPRLELMAALIAARFANTIISSLSIPIHQKFFWSDSKTVISWLKSDHKRYHQFVAFRVSEILDISNLEEWLWIPGRLNVADEATKWYKTGPNLSNDSRWLNGPGFLLQPKSEWPKQINVIELDTSCELRQNVLHAYPIEHFINIKRFSQWRRALRAVAYAVHFLNRLKKKPLEDGYNLGQSELKRAEEILVQQAQKDYFMEEIAALKCDGKVSKHSSIYKLTPYLDDNSILRVDGRIDNASVPAEFKHPSIMPRESYITRLMILHFHSQYHHGNHETVINEIRQKYHVPRLRTVYKKITRECQMCKIKNCLPINPQMAKLPRARLSSFTAPFTFTGLDFFGPISVVVNRHTEKRYGALFTCLTIRAVHVEIVHTLSTASCILAIRNFIARRGAPREIFSDNGTNFVGAERELREATKAIDTNEFVRVFTSRETKWNFNPPAAPHMGGAWERMVRSIKTVLYKIMPSRAPNDETLRSMMAEVENIVNSRPLTYVPIDHECQEALTPNHFLLGSSNGMKPLSDCDDSAIVLRNSWLYSQQYANQFWRRWVAEYLPSLTCRAKWFEKTKPLAVGDLVVVIDPSNPRNVWPRGKVSEVSVADDGQVRSARVITNCGIIHRPVSRLALLDVAQNTE